MRIHSLVSSESKRIKATVKQPSITMNKDKYIRPDLETLDIYAEGVMCQSSLGDTGTGSLNWNTGGGTDPDGSGGDFDWGN